MKSEDLSIAELLDVARELVEYKRFDAAEVMELLHVLAAEDVDVQTIGAIRHAKQVALLACNGSNIQETIARYALSRVIGLLEEQVVVGAHVDGFGNDVATGVG